MHAAFAINAPLGAFFIARDLAKSVGKSLPR
jgi:hypothetical protein